MNLKTVVLSATLLLGFTLGARAQLGVYGMVSTERLSGVNCLASASQVTPTPCSSPDRIDRPLGAGGGAYYNFMKIGPATIGGDIRADIMKANKSASTELAGKNAFRMDEALGGVRASFSFHKNELHPFAEVAAGWNRRDRTTNFLAYRAYFGLDISVFPMVDIRLPELGIGQNVSGSNGASSNFVESATVGVVFHLAR
jgi:hypothetical protein